MDCLLIIYLFILFILLIPNTVLYLPIKNNMINAMVRGLLFVFLFQITYGFVSKKQIENLEVKGTNTGSLVNIVKLLVDKFNKPKDNTEYNINNEVIQVTPAVAEEYDIIHDEKNNNSIIIPPNKDYFSEIK